MNAPTHKLKASWNQSERSGIQLERLPHHARPNRFCRTLIVGIARATGSCARHDHLLGSAPDAVVQIIASVLSILFIVTTTTRMRHTNALLRILYRVSAIWLGRF